MSDGVMSDGAGSDGAGSDGVRGGTPPRGAGAGGSHTVASVAVAARPPAVAPGWRTPPRAVRNVRRGNADDAVAVDAATLAAGNAGPPRAVAGTHAGASDAAFPEKTRAAALAPEAGVVTSTDEEEAPGTSTALWRRRISTPARGVGARRAAVAAVRRSGFPTARVAVAPLRAASGLVSAAAPVPATVAVAGTRREGGYHRGSSTGVAPVLANGTGAAVDTGHHQALGAGGVASVGRDGRARGGRWRGWAAVATDHCPPTPPARRPRQRRWHGATNVGRRLGREWWRRRWGWL